MTSTQIAVILHSPDDSLGSLPQVLQELGLRMEVFQVADYLPEPSSIEQVILMGSTEAAYDHRTPWLDRELQWLSAIHEQQKPVFGICFGSQILARSLGGQAYPNSEPEIGWTHAVPCAPEWSHAGPWMNMHFDAFDVPPGAAMLATSDIAPQAYRKGPYLGVQFHPEVTPDMYDVWINGLRASSKGSQILATRPEIAGSLREEVSRFETENRSRFKALMADYLNSL